MSRTLVSLFAVLAISAASIGPAAAESTSRTVSFAVSYADLDLTQIQGGKKLSMRLKRAADAVCGREFDAASTTLRRTIVACRTEAMASAVASIDAPLLTALYEGRNGVRFAGL